MDDDRPAKITKKKFRALGELAEDHQSAGMRSGYRSHNSDCLFEKTRHSVKKKRRKRQNSKFYYKTNSNNDNIKLTKWIQNAYPHNKCSGHCI